MEPPKFLVPNLEGVTVALVAFLLLCLAFPHLVKSKTHWYVAMFTTVLIILSQSAMTLFAGSELVRVFGVLVGVLQVLSLLMLVLAVGGLTPKQLSAEVFKTIEVIRRGEHAKEVIVPLAGQTRAETNPGPIDEPEDRVVFSLDPNEVKDEQRIPLKPSPTPEKQTGPIPME